MKSRNHTKAVLGLLGSLSLFGAAGQAQAGCELQKVVELPVTMVGLRPVVTVKINGVDVRMTIDSGASFSMLTQTDAHRIPGLRAGMIPSGMRFGGIGGEETVSLMIAPTIELAGAKGSNVEFIVGDLKGGINLLGENILRGEERGI